MKKALIPGPESFNWKG